MALNLNNLAGKTATVTIDFMGQSAKVTYDPTVITASALAKSEQSDETFAAFICEVIKDWDVMRGTKKVPLKPEAIEGIPLQFLRAVVRGVMQDTSAGEAGGNSNGG